MRGTDGLISGRLIGPSNKANSVVLLINVADWFVLQFGTLLSSVLSAIRRCSCYRHFTSYSPNEGKFPHMCVCNLERQGVLSIERNKFHSQAQFYRTLSTILLRMRSQTGNVAGRRLRMKRWWPLLATAEVPPLSLYSSSSEEVWGQLELVYVWGRLCCFHGVQLHFWYVFCVSFLCSGGRSYLIDTVTCD